MAFKRTAQKKRLDDARKVLDDTRNLGAEGGAPKPPLRIPRGAVAIAVSTIKTSADLKEEHKKAIAAKGASPAAFPGACGKLTEHARTASSKALTAGAALAGTRGAAPAPARDGSTAPVLPLPSSAPALPKSVRWRTVS